MATQTEHPHRTRIRHTGRSLLLSLVALAAVCASALPGRAQDCEVKLIGYWDGQHTITVRKSTSPVGAYDTFIERTGGGFFDPRTYQDDMDNFSKFRGIGFDADDEPDNWNDEIERVEFHGACHDAEVDLYEHRDWQGWRHSVTTTTGSTGGVLHDDRSEEASSFQVVFRNNANAYRSRFPEADVTGGLIDIAFGADNSVFGIGLDNAVYKWNGAAYTFEPFGDGRGTQLTVDTNGNPWVIAIDHTVWRFDPNAGGFIEVPPKIF